MKLSTPVVKLDLLIALYIFCIAASELMGGKTFPLFTVGTFTLNASVAIFTFPLIFTINDVILEVYGRERARSVVRSGLFVVALIFLFSVFAVSLPPSARFEATEASYDAVFGLSARIALASLIAITIAEFTDLFVFSRIRKMFGAKALWLRNNVSNFAAQFLDTVLFMTLAFYSLERTPGANAAFLLSLIIPYWLLKCAMSIIETPFVYLGVKWLKSDQAAIA
jgi:uncharacterized integral membrane protein (TIGR00697 family)